MKRPYSVKVETRDGKHKVYKCYDKPTINGDWVWIYVSLDDYIALSSQQVASIRVTRVL
jgi:hypothetical protein